MRLSNQLVFACHRHEFNALSPSSNEYTQVRSPGSAHLEPITSVSLLVSIEITTDILKYVSQLIECGIDVLSMPIDKVSEEVAVLLKRAYQAPTASIPLKNTGVHIFPRPSLNQLKKNSLGRQNKVNRSVIHYLSHGLALPNQNAMAQLLFYEGNNCAHVPLLEAVKILGDTSVYVFDCDYAGVYIDTLRSVFGDRGPIAFGATGAQERLPYTTVMGRSFPMDVFTQCFVNPLRMLVYHFLAMNPSVYSEVFYSVPYDVLYKGITAAKMASNTSMAKTLNDVLSYFIDGILWSSLPRDAYQAYRQHESIVLTLFKRFVVAQKVMAGFGNRCTSLPAIPDVSSHPLWKHVHTLIDSVLLKCNDALLNSIRNDLYSGVFISFGRSGTRAGALSGAPPGGRAASALDRTSSLAVINMVRPIAPSDTRDPDGTGIITTLGLPSVAEQNYLNRAYGNYYSLKGTSVQPGSSTASTVMRYETSVIEYIPSVQNLASLENSLSAHGGGTYGGSASTLPLATPTAGQAPHLPSKACGTPRHAPDYRSIITAFMEQHLQAFENWLDNIRFSNTIPAALPILTFNLLSVTLRLRTLKALCRFADMSTRFLRATFDLELYKPILRLVMLVDSKDRRSRVYCLFLLAKYMALDTGMVAVIVDEYAAFAKSTSQPTKMTFEEMVLRHIKDINRPDIRALCVSILVAITSRDTNEGLRRVHGAQGLQGAAPDPCKGACGSGVAARSRNHRMASIQSHVSMRHDNAHDRESSSGREESRTHLHLRTARNVISKGSVHQILVSQTARVGAKGEAPSVTHISGVAPSLVSLQGLQGLQGLNFEGGPSFGSTVRVGSIGPALTCNVSGATDLGAASMLESEGLANELDEADHLKMIRPSASILASREACAKSRMSIILSVFTFSNLTPLRLWSLLFLAEHLNHLTNSSFYNNPLPEVVQTGSPSFDPTSEKAGLGEQLFREARAARRQIGSMSIKLSSPDGARQPLSNTVGDRPRKHGIGLSIDLGLGSTATGATGPSGAAEASGVGGASGSSGASGNSGSSGAAGTTGATGSTFASLQFKTYMAGRALPDRAMTNLTALEPPLSETPSVDSKTAGPPPDLHHDSFDGLPLMHMALDQPARGAHEAPRRVFIYQPTQVRSYARSKPSIDETLALAVVPAFSDINADVRAAAVFAVGSSLPAPLSIRDLFYGSRVLDILHVDSAKYSAAVGLLPPPVFETVSDMMVQDASPLVRHEALCCVARLVPCYLHTFITACEYTICSAYNLFTNKSNVKLFMRLTYGLQAGLDISPAVSQKLMAISAIVRNLRATCKDPVSSIALRAVNILRSLDAIAMCRCSRNFGLQDEFFVVNTEHVFNEGFVSEYSGLLRTLSSIKSGRALEEAETVGRIHSTNRVDSRASLSSLESRLASGVVFTGEDIAAVRRVWQLYQTGELTREDRGEFARRVRLVFLESYSLLSASILSGRPRPQPRDAPHSQDSRGSEECSPAHEQAHASAHDSGGHADENSAGSSSSAHEPLDLSRGMRLLGSAPLQTPPGAFEPDGEASYNPEERLVIQKADLVVRRFAELSALNRRWTELTLALFTPPLFSALHACQSSVASLSGRKLKHPVLPDTTQNVASIAAIQSHRVYRACPQHRKVRVDDHGANIYRMHSMLCPCGQGSIAASKTLLKDWHLCFRSSWCLNVAGSLQTSLCEPAPDAGGGSSGTPLRGDGLATAQSPQSPQSPRVPSIISSCRGLPSVANITPQISCTTPLLAAMRGKHAAPDEASTASSHRLCEGTVPNTGEASAVASSETTAAPPSCALVEISDAQHAQRSDTSLEHDECCTRRYSLRRSSIPAQAALSHSALLRIYYKHFTARIQQLLTDVYGVTFAPLREGEGVDGADADAGSDASRGHGGARPHRPLRQPRQPRPARRRDRSVELEQAAGPSSSPALRDTSSARTPESSMPDLVIREAETAGVVLPFCLNWLKAFFTHGTLIAQPNACGSFLYALPVALDDFRYLIPSVPLSLEAARPPALRRDPLLKLLPFTRAETSVFGMYEYILSLFGNTLLDDSVYSDTILRVVRDASFAQRGGAAPAVQQSVLRRVLPGYWQPGGGTSAPARAPAEGFHNLWRLKLDQLKKIAAPSGYPNTMNDAALYESVGAPWDSPAVQALFASPQALLNALAAGRPAPAAAAASALASAADPVPARGAPPGAPFVVMDQTCQLCRAMCVSSTLLETAQGLYDRCAQRSVNESLNFSVTRSSLTRNMNEFLFSRTRDVNILGMDCSQTLSSVDTLRGVRGGGHSGGHSGPGGEGVYESSDSLYESDDKLSVTEPEPSQDSGRHVGKRLSKHFSWWRGKKTPGSPGADKRQQAQEGYATLLTRLMQMSASPYPEYDTMAYCVIELDCCPDDKMSQSNTISSYSCSQALYRCMYDTGDNGRLLVDLDNCHAAASFPGGAGPGAGTAAPQKPRSEPSVLPSPSDHLSDNAAANPEGQPGKKNPRTGSSTMLADLKIDVTKLVSRTRTPLLDEARLPEHAGNRDGGDDQSFDGYGPLPPTPRDNPFFEYIPKQAIMLVGAFTAISNSKLYSACLRDNESLKGHLLAAMQRQASEVMQSISLKTARSKNIFQDAQTRLDFCGVRALGTNQSGFLSGGGSYAGTQKGGIFGVNIFSSDKVSLRTTGGINIFNPQGKGVATRSSADSIPQGESSAAVGYATVGAGDGQTMSKALQSTYKTASTEGRARGLSATITGLQVGQRGNDEPGKGSRVSLKELQGLFAGRGGAAPSKPQDPAPTDLLQRSSPEPHSPTTARPTTHITGFSITPRKLAAEGESVKQIYTPTKEVTAKDLSSFREELERSRSSLLEERRFHARGNIPPLDAEYYNSSLPLSATSLAKESGCIPFYQDLSADAMQMTARTDAHMNGRAPLGERSENKTAFESFCEGQMEQSFPEQGKFMQVRRQLLTDATKLYNTYMQLAKQNLHLRKSPSTGLSGDPGHLFGKKSLGLLNDDTTKSTNKFIKLSTTRYREGPSNNTVLNRHLSIPHSAGAIDTLKFHSYCSVLVAKTPRSVLVFNSSTGELLNNLSDSILYDTDIDSFPACGFLSGHKHYSYPDAYIGSSRLYLWNYMKTIGKGLARQNFALLALLKNDAEAQECSVCECLRSARVPDLDIIDSVNDTIVEAAQKQDNYTTDSLPDATLDAVHNRHLLHSDTIQNLSTRYLRKRLSVLNYNVRHNSIGDIELLNENSPYSLLAVGCNTGYVRVIANYSDPILQRQVTGFRAFDILPPETPDQLHLAHQSQSTIYSNLQTSIFRVSEVFRRIVTTSGPKSRKTPLSRTGPGDGNLQPHQPATDAAISADSIDSNLTQLYLKARSRTACENFLPKELKNTRASTNRMLVSDSSAPMSSHLQLEKDHSRKCSATRPEAKRFLMRLHSTNRHILTSHTGTAVFRLYDLQYEKCIIDGEIAPSLKYHSIAQCISSIECDCLSSNVVFSTGREVFMYDIRCPDSALNIGPYAAQDISALVSSGATITNTHLRNNMLSVFLSDGRLYTIDCRGSTSRTVYTTNGLTSSSSIFQKFSSLFLAGSYQDDDTATLGHVSGYNFGKVKFSSKLTSAGFHSFQPILATADSRAIDLYSLNIN